MLQVFLPYRSFVDSAACLDDHRLRNQVWRSIDSVITGEWEGNRIYGIWKNHHRALAEYALICLDEIESRDGSYYPGWRAYYRSIRDSSPKTGMPKIVGYEPYHESHKKLLMAKAADWYGQYNWVV